uniref:Uncharacterized protein n=1 Tax=Pithovirus LCPAC406 TaxID=2506599 RepID=A0A481ZGC7_9VIRU|nr:MAG: uncharacterized protein LCPAC406_01330 [Pithovirus LCPAC406]
MEKEDERLEYLRKYSILQEEHPKAYLPPMYITDTIEKIKVGFYTAEKAFQLNSIFNALRKDPNNRDKTYEDIIDDYIKKNQLKT